MKTVVCNKCEETFEYDLKEEEGYQGSVVLLFYCSHCNAKYHVATISRRGLELRGQIQEHLRQRAENEQWIRKLESLRNRYRREVVTNSVLPR